MFNHSLVCCRCASQMESSGMLDCRSYPPRNKFDVCRSFHPEKTHNHMPTIYQSYTNHIPTNPPKITICRLCQPSRLKGEICTQIKHQEGQASQTRGDGQVFQSIEWRSLNLNLIFWNIFRQITTCFEPLYLSQTYNLILGVGWVVLIEYFATPKVLIWKSKRNWI